MPLPMLTTAEYAAIVRQSPETIADKCARGEIRAVKVGRRWLISEHEVSGRLRPKPAEVNIDALTGKEYIDALYTRLGFPPRKCVRGKHRKMR